MQPPEEDAAASPRQDDGAQEEESTSAGPDTSAQPSAAPSPRDTGPVPDSPIGTAVSEKLQQRAAEHPSSTQSNLGAAPASFKFSASEPSTQIQAQPSVASTVGLQPAQPAQQAQGSTHSHNSTSAPLASQPQIDAQASSAQSQPASQPSEATVSHAQRTESTAHSVAQSHADVLEPYEPQPYQHVPYQRYAQPTHVMPKGPLQGTHHSVSLRVMYLVLQLVCSHRSHTSSTWHAVT